MRVLATKKFNGTICLRSYFSSERTFRVSYERSKRGYAEEMTDNRAIQVEGMAPAVDDEIDTREKDRGRNRPLEMGAGRCGGSGWSRAVGRGRGSFSLQEATGRSH